MSNFVECVHCDKRIDVNEGYDAYTDHVDHCGTRPLTVDDMQEVAQQIAEIHAFVKSLAEALNSPMLKAMLPPNMRGMLGG